MLNIPKHHSEKVQLFSVFCFQEAPIIFCAALERTVFWSGLPVIMNPTKRVHLTSGGGRPSAMSVIMFQLNLKVQNIKKHFHKEENLPESNAMLMRVLNLLMLRSGTSASAAGALNMTASGLKLYDLTREAWLTVLHSSAEKSQPVLLAWLQTKTCICSGIKRYFFPANLEDSSTPSSSSS